jgi:hypothetical protein
MEIFFMGILTGVAIIILLFKMGIGKFIRFGWQTDVILSAGLAFIFVGTMSGMMIGIIAGIVVSLFLSFMKKLTKSG